jgi:two-component system, OmpR family, sensor histidine kinase ChvG
MASKPSMASATAIENRDASVKATPLPRARQPTREARRSGIAGLIFAANLAGLLVLIGGALVLNELRTGLIAAKVDSLTAQGQTIASLLAEAATDGEPEPALVPERARLLLKRLSLSEGVRVRLFDRNRTVLADSRLLFDEVEVRPLPPINAPDPGTQRPDWLTQARLGWGAILGLRGITTLSQEYAGASAGEPQSVERLDEAGERVVSVSLPVARVKAVVGVLTLESGDVDAIVVAERIALVPFIVVAMLVAAASSTLLTVFIARPLRRLASAADAVRAGTRQDLSAADLGRREDEIGELAIALDAMTKSLAQRIEANARFAADVAHEIKNPLASIRNAADLLPRAKDDLSRQRMEGIIAADVKRLDRLVTDISNATRMEAEMARVQASSLSLKQLLTDIVAGSNPLLDDGAVQIVLELGRPDDDLTIRGREEAIARVFRNLLDNAVSFSPKGGNVRLLAGRPVNTGTIRINVEDSGPGIPPESVESVFERFYTHRPKTHGFGTHSGLGLAITRQIVEAHGGSIRAENRMEAQSGEILGARFIVDLPAL